MQISMTAGSIVALFGTMLVLALIPGVSVWAVTARAVAYGFTHGLAVTLGILLGDIVFILLALYGLVFLAESMGSLFVFIKYLGSAYLLWLGVTLLRTKPKAAESKEVVESSLSASFLLGLFITFGDQKAILFYLGFLPAFLDLSNVSIGDTVVVIAVATLALGLAKLGYAFLAGRASAFLKNTGANKVITKVAGVVMILVGIFIAIEA